jgi:Mg2+/Co2+ transporter CorB
MTVKDLIEFLQRQLPKDAVLYVDKEGEIIKMDKILVRKENRDNWELPYDGRMTIAGLIENCDVNAVLFK